MKRWLMLGLALGAWASALAGQGNETGNGGAGVVCADFAGGIASVELLDFYEAAMLADLTPALGQAEKPLEKVALALDRLSRLDAGRAALYRRVAGSFFENARFIDQVILPDTKDYGHVPLKKHCRIEQVAIQREPLLPGYKRYTVSRDLWSRLSADHQAGLILHEVVYGYAIKLGHKDSIGSRYFTALVASDRLASMAGSEYDAVVKRLALVDPEHQPPAWVMDPVRLPAAQVGQVYTASLKAFVHHPGGLPLKMKAHGQPAWLSVMEDGYVAGKPHEADAGEHAFSVVASDGLHDVGARVIVRVISGTPQWKADRIDLGIQREGQLWLFDLRTAVVSAVSGLRFSAHGLPAWMALSHEGLLSGTPQRKDVGPYSGIRLAVQSPSQESGAIAAAYGLVIRQIQPPVWMANPLALPDAHEDVPYFADLKAHVLSPEGIALEFRQLGGVSWVTVTSDGRLTGVPRKASVGDNRIILEVSATIDGQTFSSATDALVRVGHVNHSPTWTQVPIPLEVCGGKVFTFNLAPFVADIDGDPLVFSLLEGPAWGSLSAHGMLTVSAPAGTQEARFRVRVSDPEGLYANGEVLAKVKICP